MINFYSRLNVNSSGILCSDPDFRVMLRSRRHGISLGIGSLDSTNSFSLSFGDGEVELLSAQMRPFCCSCRKA